MDFRVIMFFVSAFVAYGMIVQPLLVGVMLTVGLLSYSWTQRTHLDIKMDNEITSDGYRDVAIPIDRLLGMRSVFALSLGLFILPIPIYFMFYDSTQFSDTFLRWQTLILAFPAVIFFIAMHELTHALGWMVFGRLSWSTISFGIDRKTFSPYAHANMPMPARAYRIGAALPSITTGLLPICWGLFTGNGAITVLGAFLLSAAVGDFVVLWIIRHVPADALVRDHPEKAGCLVKIE